MKLGIDIFLENKKKQQALKKRRISFLGHPASVTSHGAFSLDALWNCSDLHIVSAFGPQHGMRGEKQDNMVESEDYIDPQYNIPVFSLYGQTRYPTIAMMDSFDALIIDLQDIGTRIYTFVTTIIYCLEACTKNKKSVWILDRPNPAGRPIDGTILESGWESFVGAAPLILRHGLTLGELAKWIVTTKKLDLDLNIVAMTEYFPNKGPGYGWPINQLSWINPSPNASSLNMTRCYPGTVLFEGTTLSEGRGTTNALEVFGAPNIDVEKILKRMRVMKPEWTRGCFIRKCFFEPVFHKHAGTLCSGIQIHTDNSFYQHEQFKSYRLCALALKALRNEYPDYQIWRQFPYEYETERLAIDLINGGTLLREWIDNPGFGPEVLEKRLKKDENEWLEIRSPFLIY